MSATLRPYTELTTASAVRFALMWQVIGLLLLASHILLVKQSLWLFPVAILFLMWLYANAPLAGLLVILQFLIYQNWMISLLVTGMDRLTFSVLQGTNFAALAAIAAIAWFHLMVPFWRKTLWPALVVTMLALILATCYAIFGALRAGPVSATIYYRETTTLVLAALVGLDVGRVWGYRTIAIGFLASTVLSLGLCLVEILSPEAYYDVINAVATTNLKTDSPRFTIYTAQEVIDLNSTMFFNVSGGIESVGRFAAILAAIPNQRFMGTVMHPISYAYILAAIGIIGWSIKRTVWLLLAIPLLILSSVKGANLLLFCTFALWYNWYLTKSRGFLIGCGCLFMVAYVAFGISNGIQSGDFHVLGFLGGYHGFIASPIGHGIGVGGNLSTAAMPGVNWERSQHMGATDFAMESAVGVLLYQMGIAAAAIFTVFFILCKMAPFGSPSRGILQPQRRDILFVALMSVAVNGFFQEEAYAPYAAGLYAMLCAIIVANGRRNYIEAKRPIRSLTVRSLTQAI